MTTLPTKHNPDSLPPLLYYYQGDKTPELSKAIQHGFKIEHIRPVEDAKCFPGDWIHVISSLQHGAFNILRECRESGKLYIFIDNPYLFYKHEGPLDTHMYRIVPNAFQHNWTPHIFDAMRIYELTGTKEYMGPILEPWNCKPMSKGKLLIVPQSSYESNKLYYLHGWLNDVYKKVQAKHQNIPNERIKFRMKSDSVKLAMDLLESFAVIAYTSNVVVDALRAGIPTFCSYASAGYPIAQSLNNLNMLGCIVPEPDRINWIRGLLCGQFTVKEIGNGFALEYVMLEMQRRLREHTIR